jgi:chaperone required for assembly of F1-ATPase
LAKLSAVLQDESLLVLAAMVSVTGLTGSGLLAIGLWHKLFTPDHAWTVAHLDEDFQARQWGEDEEAMARRTKRKREFDAAVMLLDLLHV